MLLIAVVVIVGLVRRQPGRYWWHALAAVVVQNLAWQLFNAGGTVQNPSGDGLVTALIRSYGGDEAVLLLFPFAMLTGWVIPIWLVVRGYHRREKSE